MARRGFPMARGGGQDLPARERSPRRRHPDTAHERKNLPRAETLPTAKASRHSARAKEFAPQGNALLGEGLPTRHTGERICPRRNAPLGEGLPTRRTGERICPAQERSPRRRLPDTAHERKNLPRGGSRSPHMPTNGGPLPTDGQPEKHPFGGVAPETAHERKDLPRAETFPSAKASRHGARAKGFAPRRNALLGEGLPTQRTGERICPTRERSRPTCRRTEGRPRPTDSRKNTPSAGSHPRGRGRCRVHSPKKNKTTP